MGFLDKLDRFIIAPHITVPNVKPRTANWPTEASFKGENGVIGKCIRQNWYNAKGFLATNPIDKKGRSIFDLGNMIEDWYIERAKQMGAWAANSVRYYDELYNISSEIDLIIFDDIGDGINQLVGVECKSAYGHYADKEVSQGPKVEHLMQVCLNLDFMNRTHVNNSAWSRKFYIEYFMRDSCNRYEHVIELIVKDGKTYPMVNGIEVYTFYLEGIYARYEELSVVKNLDNPPDRDFVYAYGKEEIAQRHKDGKIPKAKYMAWMKGKKTISDWQCLYCPHLDRCWPEKRTGIKGPVDELLEYVDAK